MKTLRLLFLLALLLGWQRTLSPAAEPDANSGPLVIGFLGDVSGPVGFWNAPRLAGIQDAIEYVNSELGGVAGRPFGLQWRDHRSDAGLAEKYYRELKPLTYHIWHTCGTGEQQMLKPLMERDLDKIFLTCSTSPGVVYPVGNVFGTGPYYPDQFAAFVDWLAEKYRREGIQHSPKVALLTYKSGYGRAFITQESLQYAKSRGVEVFEPRYIPFVTKDALGPLLEAKEAGAEWVFGHYLYQTLPPLLKANREQKLGLRFAVINFTVDDVLIEKSGEAAEGVVGITSWALPGEKAPGMSLLKKYLKQKNRFSEDRAAGYLLGWMNVLQTHRVLKETLDSNAGDWSKVTPKSIRKTMERWVNVNIQGLGTLTFSPDRRTTSRVRIVEVRGGQWVPQSDWFDAPNLAPGEYHPGHENQGEVHHPQHQGGEPR